MRAFVLLIGVALLAASPSAPSAAAKLGETCDGIAARTYWQQYGLPNDGKGEPTQINAMSHGCAPARFRQINVLATD